MCVVVVCIDNIKSVHRSYGHFTHYMPCLVTFLHLHSVFDMVFGYYGC